MLSIFVFYCLFIHCVNGENNICGATKEDCSWNLNNGVLTITGSGEMSNWWFDSVDIPWYSRRNEITEVVIEEGITKLGLFAFKDCTSLTTVHISSTVTYFDDRCFYNCPLLSFIDVDEKNKIAYALVNIVGIPSAKTMDDLLKNVESRYLLVNLVAQRARQIALEADAFQEELPEKPVTLAINEVARGELSASLKEEYCN